MGRVAAVAALLAQALAAQPADRTVAEWALYLGGRVRLVGQALPMTAVTDLPDRELPVEVLDLVGVNIEPQDLERLSGLRSLRELHLPGPLWSRNADGGKDLSGELRHLRHVTTLERLTFSYHFLDRLRFRDHGLKEIGNLVNMKELVLRQAETKGHTLAPFQKLEALDVTLCPFDDTGLQNLAGMANLRRLWIGDTEITDAGLAHIAGLVKLVDLDLHGTRITDAGLAHLKGLTGLTKLNLMADAVSDAGLSHLAALQDLEQLNLYRTKVTRCV